MKPSKIKGEEVVNIRKNPGTRFEDVTWEEFESILKKKGLAVYKDDKSDFLKIKKK